MAYRNKTYVAFDADNDMRYYNLMKAWKQSESISFDFYDAHDINYARDSSKEESIKKQLRERMANSKIFVLLLGEKTRYLTKFVKWEIEHALYLNLPIIVVNLNGRKDVDSERMPPWLKDELSISCSYNAKIIAYSLEHWGDCHKIHMQNPSECGPYRWKNSVYQELGLL